MEAGDGAAHLTGAGDRWRDVLPHQVCRNAGAEIVVFQAEDLTRCPVGFDRQHGEAEV